MSLLKFYVKMNLIKEQTGNIHANKDNFNFEF